MGSVLSKSRQSEAHRSSGATVRQLKAVARWHFTAASSSGGRRRASVALIARGSDGERGGANGGGRRWSEVGSHCEGVEAAATASISQWSGGGTSGRVSYLVFMPKLSTHHMHDPGSIVPHIRPKSVHR
jgi:hypothetical protein